MRGGVAAAPLVSRERERRKLEWACHGDGVVRLKDSEEGGTVFRVTYILNQPSAVVLLLLIGSKSQLLPPPGPMPSPQERTVSSSRTEQDGEDADRMPSAQYLGPASAPLISQPKSARAVGGGEAGWQPVLPSPQRLGSEREGSREKPMVSVILE